MNEIVNTNERQNPDLNDLGTTSVIPFTKQVTYGKTFKIHMGEEGTREEFGKLAISLKAPTFVPIMEKIRQQLSFKVSVFMNDDFLPCWRKDRIAERRKKQAIDIRMTFFAIKSRGLIERLLSL